MNILTAIVALVLVYVSFTISASAGLGGSLLMVPTLALFLGSKEGVALAALLLASNNVMKIYAYRRTLPFRAAAAIVVLIVVGAAIGATLLVKAPDWAVTIGIVVMFIASVLAERFRLARLRKGFAPLLAFVSGASSGFSGTSGPLKGVAIRNLDLDRRHFVGAASLASFAGDATKTAIFADGSDVGPHRRRRSSADGTRHLDRLVDQRQGGGAHVRRVVLDGDGRLQRSSVHPARLTRAAAQSPRRSR